MDKKNIPFIGTLKYVKICISGRFKKNGIDSFRSCAPRMCMEDCEKSGALRNAIRALNRAKRAINRSSHFSSMRAKIRVRPVV